jgi:D-cysteine desulfhydrase family pyridoxal phosphate-dependent enzyme
MTRTAAVYTTDDLLERLSRLPRYPLAHLPTPLEFLPRFSEALGGPRIWIKRDDCTGLAFGGNKARHNEFIIADALEQRADTVVWGAGVQSNNCRQTAAACAKAGLACHLVLGRGRPADGPDPVQGNLLLDHLVGASVEIVDEAEGPAVDEKIALAADRLRGQGCRVYERLPKIVKPLAALSYVTAVIELLEQAAQADVTPDALYVCSAGSTGAGISLATVALGQTFAVQHITPIVWPWDTQAVMTDIANSAAERLGIATRLEPTDINVTEEYVGVAYGVPTTDCLEAIALLARTEGILLDPSYSGKSMAGLIDHIREGRFTSEQNVIFIHTGGTPALFAYNEQLAAEIEPKSI